MSSSDTNHRRIIRGVSWSAFERLSVQGVQLAVFVFMARVLTPTDYGLVGMLWFFIIVCQLIAEGGLSQAIIRKLDRTEQDLSTAFWVNIIIGLALYAALWLTSPMTARFYDEPRLVELMRVLAAVIPIQSTLVVHRSILTANLDFMTQAKATLVGAIFSGGVGLAMAYNGWGVWSIAGLQLTNQLATATTLWLVTDWRPRLMFSRPAFVELFGLGSKLIAGKVVQNLYNGLYVMIIGKVFAAYPLGSYTNARRLGAISSENLTNIVQRAAYPAFVRHQANPQRLHTSVREYMRISMFFIAPLMFGLAALAEPLTLGLIGHKWLYTAKLLRILCVYFLLYPLNSINYMLLEINGRGATYLWLQILSIILGAGALVATINFGLSAVCVGMVAASAISYAINARIAGATIGYGLRRQIKSIFSIMFCALVAGLAMALFSWIIEGNWLRVSLSSLIGLVVYIALAIVFLNPLCKHIISLGRRKSAS